MGRTNSYDSWKTAFIRVNASNHTASELSQMLEVPVSFIYSFCKHHGLRLKKYKPGEKLKRVTPTTSSDYLGDDILVQDPIKKQRPPAVYTNRSPYGLAEELRKIENEQRNTNFYKPKINLK
jgi:hypothetical protein